MALTNPQKAKLGGLLVAMLAAIGIVLAPGEAPTRNPVLDALADAGLHHTGQGGTTTDLLSPEVPAHGTATVVVTLEGNITGIEIVKPATFDVSETHVYASGITTVTVTVTNTTGQPRTFAGFLSYTVVPPDASVPLADAGTD